MDPTSRDTGGMVSNQGRRFQFRWPCLSCGGLWAANGHPPATAEVWIGWMGVDPQRRARLHALLSSSALLFRLLGVEHHRLPQFTVALRVLLDSPLLRKRGGFPDTRRLSLSLSTGLQTRPPQHTCPPLSRRD
ncbi:unnamed protein product [Mortierella alpina]